jgi:DNA transposition AAA+ family ATPase
MTDENKLNTATLRGAQAKHLIEHDLLREAFDQLRRTYIDKLLASEARDNDARERLYIAARVVDQVKEHLYRVLQDGNLAAKELDNLTVEAKRKRFGIV